MFLDELQWMESCKNVIRSLQGNMIYKNTLLHVDICLPKMNIVFIYSFLCRRKNNFIWQWNMNFMALQKLRHSVSLYDVNKFFRNWTGESGTICRIKKYSLNKEELLSPPQPTTLKNLPRMLLILLPFNPEMR